MKKLTAIVVASMMVVMLLSGFSSAKTNINTNKVYKFKVSNVKVSSRGITIPATLTIPIGTKNEKFPLVVMNHGHGGSRSENGGFSGIAEALARKGVITIRMDFPGCGESIEPFTQNTLKNMISDSNASLNYALKKAPVDNKKLGIFGYSQGGRIALTIAPKSSYRAMALLAPSANAGIDMMTSFMGGQEAYDSLYNEANGEKGYCDFTTPFGQKQKLSKVWFEEMLASSPLKNIKAYKGDVIVLYGDKDTTVLPEISKSVIETVKDTAKSALATKIAGADHGYGFYSDQTAIKAKVTNTIADFFVKKFK